MVNFERKIVIELVTKTKNCDLTLEFFWGAESSNEKPKKNPRKIINHKSANKQAQSQCKNL